MSICYLTTYAIHINIRYLRNIIIRYYTIMLYLYTPACLYSHIPYTLYAMHIQLNHKLEEYRRQIHDAANDLSELQQDLLHEKDQNVSILLL